MFYIIGVCDVVDILLPKLEKKNAKTKKKQARKKEKHKNAAKKKETHHQMWLQKMNAYETSASMGPLSSPNCYNETFAVQVGTV